MARLFCAFILLSFILLSGAASAITQNSAAILEFASFAVPHGAQFSIQPFPYRGSDCFAVVSGGEIYGIFESGLPLFEDTPLTAPDDIENALTAYYAYQNYSPNITFNDVHAGLLSVMANYHKGEAKCRILTGTDRTACTSFETCQKACYSVTSFCMPIALGTGRAFVNEIWKFENSSKLLGAAYLNESVAYSSLQDGITYGEAKAYLDTLISLNRAATTASKSALYDGYSYCFEPDYALPVITNMQLTAQKRFAQSEPFFTLTEQAMAVRNRTSTALEAMSLQQRDAQAAQAAKDAALAAQKAADAAAQNASTSAQQPAAQASQPDSGFPLALAGAGLLGVIFIVGIYFAFFSKKKKKVL